MVAPSAARPAVRGSMSGNASACRSATVAPAIQMMASPIVAAAAATGPRARAAVAARAANANEASAAPVVVAKEVVHRRGVDIYTCNRVAGKLLARDGDRQRA